MPTIERDKRLPAKIKHPTMVRGTGDPIELEFLTYADCPSCSPLHGAKLGVLFGAELDYDARGTAEAPLYLIRKTGRTVTLHCAVCDYTENLPSSALRADGTVLH